MAKPKEERMTIRKGISKMRNKFFFCTLTFLAFFFVTWVFDSGIFARITPTWVIAAFTVVLAVATIVLAVATSWNIKIARDLLKQSGEASKLSRDTGLYNYANNYLTSLVKTLEKDKLRELYTRMARKIIYNALEELLSPETAKKIKEFRGIVDAQLTEEIAKTITINQNLKK